MTECKEGCVFLTIVVATYNYGKFLQTAIDSVVNQSKAIKQINGRNLLELDIGVFYELIIVDGGSTDDSESIIKQNANKIAWWVSEPDNGQSNAFNKGFSHGLGLFLTWLNADDILMPGTIQAVYSTILGNSDVDWLTGNFLRFRSGTGEILQASWGPHVWPRMFQRNGFPIPVFGPSSFWSRKAYDTIGPINEQLHYMMDIEYWERLIMNGYKLHRINHCCWGFRMHEQSKTAEFDTHERSRTVKNKMANERAQITKTTGHSVTKWGYATMVFVRLLDGSAVVDIWRRLFYRGSTLGRRYGII